MEQDQNKNQITRQKQKKNRFILPALIIILGVGILLYPSASNYYMYLHQSRAIVEYKENISALDNEDVARMWEEAVEYNRLLYLAQQAEEIPDDFFANYDNILHVTDDGMIGYISIPSIKMFLPIFHGTSDNVLQKGIGHWEFSSFPVGGANTHAVLTGHNGLTSSRIFTDLEKVEVGDTFVLQIVGETMTYEVDTIDVVLPNEIDSLSIVEGEDLCTLDTCVPYGVNSHRLLVHGRRIKNAPEAEVDAAEEAGNSALADLLRMVAMIGAGLVILIVLAGAMSKKRK